MDRPTVLLYGFSTGDSKKIKPLCERLGLKLRKVLPEEYGQPVGAFVGKVKYSQANEPSDDVVEEMIVLSDVTERQLESFLSGLRTARVGRMALKAVVTETNARWTSVQLFRELQKERTSLGDTPVMPGAKEDKT